MLACILLLPVIAGYNAGLFMQTGSTLRLAPLHIANPVNRISNSYIIVFREDVPEDEVHSHYNGIADIVNVAHRYDIGGFRGYAVRNATEAFIRNVRELRQVAYVEQDQVVSVQDVQTDAGWGLARVSHRKLDFRTSRRYPYVNGAGNNVNAYVIDTGIRITHSEFASRAVWGVTIPLGEPNDDNNGHGTHVAGTIGGVKYGVAKWVTLVSVKVLRGNGSGANSDVIAGCEWTLNHWRNSQRKGVVNMSVGGYISQAINQAVTALSDAGLHVIVAAGNNKNDDACNYSPASADRVITVGATTILDARASYSNTGRCVTLFAPGSDILSAGNANDGATAVLSGTSMATPHVSGVVAALLSLGQVSPGYNNVLTWLKTFGTPNTLRDVGSSPNLLVWSNPPSQ